MAEFDIELEEGSDETWNLILDPTVVIDNSLSVMLTLWEFEYDEENPPYESFEEDRKKMLIKSMAIIRKAQLVLQKQLDQL